MDDATLRAIRHLAEALLAEQEAAIRLEREVFDLAVDLAEAGRLPRSTGARAMAMVRENGRKRREVINEVRSALREAARDSDPSLQAADLPGANLKPADLPGANLKPADLPGANLKPADLNAPGLNEWDTPATRGTFVSSSGTSDDDRK